MLVSILIALLPFLAYASKISSHRLEESGHEFYDMSVAPHSIFQGPAKFCIQFAVIQQGMVEQVDKNWHLVEVSIEEADLLEIASAPTPNNELILMHQMVFEYLVSCAMGKLYRKETLMGRFRVISVFARAPSGTVPISVLIGGVEYDATHHYNSVKRALAIDLLISNGHSDNTMSKEKDAHCSTWQLTDTFLDALKNYFLGGLSPQLGLSKSHQTN